MDVISALEEQMNREEQRTAAAFVDADLTALFDDDATKEERALRFRLIGRASRVLVDARNRDDLPDDIRRAAAIINLAGFVA